MSHEELEAIKARCAVSSATIAQHDVPALIAEIERLRFLEMALAWHRREFDSLGAEIKSLRGEFNAMGAALFNRKQGER